MQNDTKRDKVTQNKPKGPKKRTKLTRNDTKQRKTSQKDPKEDLP